MSIELDLMLKDEYLEDNGEITTHFKSIIFLNVPDGKRWITPKIMFYRSSGSSNSDDLNIYRYGTFLPTTGFLIKDIA